MAAIIDALADAVVVAINGGTYGVAFTATKSWLPLFEVKDLAAAKVSVVPSAAEDEVQGRGQSYLEGHLIEVGVQQKVSEDHSEIPDLVELCQAIKDEVRSAGPMSAAGSTLLLVESSVDPLFIPGHLKERLVFTSVVRLLYRVVR